MARISVVEDDHVIRELLVVNLKMEGHEAVTAADGHKLAPGRGRSAADVDLLDMMLHGLDGWEVTSRLKADRRTSGIPIVALFAQAMQADIERGRELGVDHYVTKPFDPIDLMKLVGSLTGERDGP